MGLDMYLERRTYVKNWSHQKDEERFAITVTKGGEPYNSIKPERVKYVIEEVAYWRKANAIHAWFVDNVQNGNDDCGHYDVSTNQLRELIDACKDALETDKPQDVLPTRRGFFFGSIEYDKYYKQDLEDTVKMLSELLAENNDDGWYEYHSSW